ncbi:MAG TPA: cation transporter [Rhodospirillaceae bacterium]|nr:cation transporter [Rhodospirillaceae bacterium]
MVLAILWLMPSGLFDNMLILGLGAASVASVLYIAHRMDVIDHEGHPIHLGWRAVAYWPWLLWEILKANLDVAKIIISPRMNIQPHIFVVNASQSSELGHVIYANSITLTPGTVTVDVEDGVMSVHALTQDAADGVKTGEMDDKVTAFEGGDEGKS